MIERLADMQELAAECALNALRSKRFGHEISGPPIDLKAGLV
jgi:hypothetical protein